MVNFLHTVAMDIIYAVCFFTLLFGVPTGILLVHHLLTYKKDGK